MRLALIIYDSLNQQTGGYLYDRKLVECLQAQGDQVEVISLPWRNYLSHLGDNLSPALFRQLTNLKVDILIEDELNHPSLAVLNHLLRRKKSFTLVSIVHHLRCNEENRIWQRWFYQLVERAFLSSLQGLICNSQTTLRSVQAVLPSGSGRNIPSVIAYPGKDHLSGGLSDAEIERRARQSHHLRLLFLGNLIPRKGLHWLLTAVSRLTELPIYIDVVGDESRDAAYARYVHHMMKQASLQERVRFWGAVDEATLRNILMQAHVLALPSSYEGFGIAYLDGMRYGLAVLGSTHGGASELIREGIEGYLVEPGDIPALANRLQELHTDRTHLARMGIAARRRFEQHPTWAESAAIIRRFLLNLLA